MTEPSSRPAAPRGTSGQDWPLRLSLVLLLLAGGLALAKNLGEGPAHLQTGHHLNTVYAAVLAYEYAAFPVTGCIFLAWALLVTMAASRFREPLRRRPALIAAAVTSVALLWAGLSTLPQMFVGYEHLMSVRTAGADYRLGVRTAMDGDYFYVLSQCPHGQLRCTAYGVAAMNADEHADFSRVRLTIGNTADAVVIQTVSRTIPFTLPAPEGATRGPG